MKISYIAIGAIASVLAINSVMAAGENTVASKSYVDARDDLKQDMIPETGTNSLTPGDTVVTYTNREGVIGERGIYNGENDYDEDDDADSLVTAGVIADFAAAVENLSINNQVLTRVNGSGNACSSGDDCNLWLVGDNTQSIAPGGTFAPLTSVQLKRYNESATLASECASGYLQSGQNKCGCLNNTECTELFPDSCRGGVTRCLGNRTCGCQ